MANTIDSQILADGPRKYAVKTVIQSDGVTGDETGTVIFDVSSLTSATAVRVDKIQFSATGCSAVVNWGSLEPTPLVTIPSGDSGVFDFTAMGGVHSDASNPTGDIIISTTGLATAGDALTLVIEAVVQ